MPTRCAPCSHAPPPLPTSPPPFHWWSVCLSFALRNGGGRGGEKREGELKREQSLFWGRGRAAWCAMQHNSLAANAIMVHSGWHWLNGSQLETLETNKQKKHGGRSRSSGWGCTSMSKRGITQTGVAFFFGPTPPNLETSDCWPEWWPARG